MHRISLLLVGAVAFGVAALLASGGTKADPGSLCPTAAGAAIQLAQTAETEILTCCFEGSGETCSISSPNRGGCEWTLVYRCKDGEYTCDDETKVCACNQPGEVPTQ